MKKGIYRFNFDCGRQGTLTGVFVATDKEVEVLVNHKIEVYFGEVLGKHSDISGAVEENEIELLTDHKEAVALVEDYGLETGHDPFQEYAYDFSFEDYGFESEDYDVDDLTVREIVNILIKEGID